jgi:hypothetical protein
MGSEGRLYSLLSLPSHLAASEGWERFGVLLTDLGFVKAKLLELGPQSLINRGLRLTFSLPGRSARAV